jgi:hypothetical protein
MEIRKNFAGLQLIIGEIQGSRIQEEIHAKKYSPKPNIAIMQKNKYVPHPIKCIFHIYFITIPFSPHSLLE